jgi:ADP-ribosyl-[dinitrogen reductase] hydrolase
MYKVSAELSSWFDKIDSEMDVDCAGNHIGYLHIAFHWAFTYLKNKVIYRFAIRDILSKGGDTDTNAAIVGGLLGAQGINNIDPYWIN